eukprot:Rmarinus@m.24441
MESSEGSLTVSRRRRKRKVKDTEEKPAELPNPTASPPKQAATELPTPSASPPKPAPVLEDSRPTTPRRVRRRKRHTPTTPDGPPPALDHQTPRTNEEAPNPTPDAAPISSRSKASSDRRGRERSPKTHRSLSRSRRSSSRSRRSSSRSRHSRSRSRSSRRAEKVLGIHVHGIDYLKPSLTVSHPCVKLHLVNPDNGAYRLKSSLDRPAVAPHECVTMGNGETSIAACPFLLPVMTKAAALTAATATSPVWDEEIIINEDSSRLLSANTLLLIEVIDPQGRNRINLGRRIRGGWNHIAWGFLRLLGHNGVTHVNERLRVQLFKYNKVHQDVSFREAIDGNSLPNRIPGVYRNWKNGKRKPYARGSSIEVTLVLQDAPEKKIVRNERPMLPTDVEEGSIPYKELLARSRAFAARDFKQSAVKLTNENLRLKWKIGQRCHLPTSLYAAVPVGDNGCFRMAYSHDGKFLAYHCTTLVASVVMHEIRVVDSVTFETFAVLKGHHELIYDLQFSPDNGELVSCSGDGTAKIWQIQPAPETVGGVEKVTLFHPCFVYTARFHPTADNPRQLATGGFDHVIRIWDCVTGTMLRELLGHTSTINTLAFEKDGSKLYSGDGHGEIRVWTAYQPHGRPLSPRAPPDQIPPTPLTAAMTPVMTPTARKTYERIRTIRPNELQGVVINFIKLHPNGRQLLVHSRNNLIAAINTSSWAVEQRFSGFTSCHTHSRCEVSPDGKFVFSGSEDGRLFVWNSLTGGLEREAWDVGFESRDVLCDVCWHPTLHMAAVCSFGRHVPIAVLEYSEDGDQEKRDEPSTERSKGADAEATARKAPSVDHTPTTVRDEPGPAHAAPSDGGQDSVSKLVDMLKSLKTSDPQ